MSGERKRTIKLFCPCLSKLVPFVAWEDQSLDLGSIARIFGFDPATLKLNGHFISRGVDLVASSVTWRSLLSFFSARGLSTGATDADAIIADGKLSKVGTKRVHDPTYVETGIEHENDIVNQKFQLEDTNLHRRKKSRKGNSGHEYGDCEITKGNEFESFDSFGLKRKQCSEDLSSLKRLRGIDMNSGIRSSEDGLTHPNTKLQCSYVNEHVKQRRADQMVVTTPMKRTR